MTKRQLIQQIESLRDDDPVVIEIDNSYSDFSEVWNDIFDFEIKTEKLDEEYTEIRFKVIPN